MMRESQPNWKGLAVAFLATAATAGFRQHFFGGYLSAYAPFQLFSISVLIAACYGGLWPGVVATVLSTLAALHFFTTSSQWSLRTPSGCFSLLLFLVIGLVVSLLCHALRVTKRRAIEKQDQLAHEIGERRKIEQNLRENRQVLQSLIETLPGVTYRNSSGSGWTFTYISDQIRELLGHDASDIIERRVPWKGLIHPEDYRRVNAAILNAIRNKKPYQLEYRMYRRDGEEIWVRDSGQGIFEDDGALLVTGGFIVRINRPKLTVFGPNSKPREFSPQARRG